MPIIGKFQRKQKKDVPAWIGFQATAGSNTLHLRTQTAGYDCTIDWGDGSKTNAPTNGGNVVHNYASAGLYDIKISGKSFAGFYVNYQTGKEKYVAAYSLGKWEVDTLTSCDHAFWGCLNLKTLSRDLFRYGKQVTTFYYCFDGCKALTTIPAGLFRNNTAVTTFYSCFYGCTALSSLPNELFRYNVAVTDFRGCFNSCTSLVTIPADLFRYNVAVELFSSCFSGCSLLADIPSGLFDHNTVATEFSACFEWTAVTSIPDELFRYNTKSIRFYRCFSNCLKLQRIGIDVFRYNESSADFSYCFYGCAVLMTLPTDIFKYNMVGYDFTSCFQACTKLTLRDDMFGKDYENRFKESLAIFPQCFSRNTFTGTKGTAPELWRFTGLTNHGSCFAGAGNSATSLSNYSSIPANWK